MRTIRVWSTQGNDGVVEIQTEVATWGELKPILSGRGYNMKKGVLSATENVNRTTLVHESANLPVGDFVLFLKPIKTKSGSCYSELSWGQLRGEVTEDVKEFLNSYVEGKNWTQLTTEELRSGLEEYNGASEECEEYQHVIQSVSPIGVSNLAISVEEKVQQIKDILGEEVVTNNLEEQIRQLVINCISMEWREIEG